MKRTTYILALLFLLCIISKLQAQSGWSQQPCGTISLLNEVSAKSASVCYVTDPNDGLLKTTDGGDNWFFLSLPSGAAHPNHLCFTSTNIGYISVTYQSTLRILKTTNAGTNWSLLDFVFNHSISKIDFISDNTGWVSSNYSADSVYPVYKTTNGGNNWTLADPNSGQISYIFFTSLDTGYLSSYYRGFFSTFNGGANWSFVNSMNFNSIFFVNSQTGWGTTYGAQPHLIEKTTNCGVDWIPQFNYGSALFYGTCFVSPTNGYVVGDTGKILFTSNAGLTWNTQTTNKKGKLFSAAFIDLNTGWVVGDSGVILKTTNGGNPIGISPISNEIPQYYKLSQNYPNPFNPTTNIEFDIPKSSFVKLTIYDINGRVIQTLVNEELKAGTYRVDFNGVNLSSGMYFYKLETKDFIQTKKIVLLK